MIEVSRGLDTVTFTVNGDEEQTYTFPLWIARELGACFREMLEHNLLNDVMRISDEDAAEVLRSVADSPEKIIYDDREGDIVAEEPKHVANFNVQMELEPEFKERLNALDQKFREYKQSQRERRKEDWAREDRHHEHYRWRLDAIDEDIRKIREYQEFLTSVLLQHKRELNTLNGDEDKKPTLVGFIKLAYDEGIVRREAE